MDMVGGRPHGLHRAHQRRAGGSREPAACKGADAHPHPCAAGEILPGEISEVRFENHKDAPVSVAGDSARTGDDSPVMLYLASALLALLLAAFALLLRRRLKR